MVGSLVILVRIRSLNAYLSAAGELPKETEWRKWNRTKKSKKILRKGESTMWMSFQHSFDFDLRHHFLSLRRHFWAWTLFLKTRRTCHFWSLDARYDAVSASNKKLSTLLIQIISWNPKKNWPEPTMFKYAQHHSNTTKIHKKDEKNDRTSE